MSSSNNIAHSLENQAASQPFVRAVVVACKPDRHGRAAYRHLTFRQLNERSGRFAAGLERIGITRGTKTLLMVRPGLDFYALTFAIFKVGAVPVLIDPGMGWRAFMRCVEQAEPQAFLGIPAAHVLRLLFPRYFRSIDRPVTMGRRWFWRSATLDGLLQAGAARSAESVEADETAAILFTTGSTGPAKGVTYTHRIFCTQVGILQREYGVGPGDIDLPCFPLFGLFSTALGATAVIPDMDPSRPAHVDPERIVGPILDHGVTYSFGSPTLWGRVGRYCRDRGIHLQSLRRIIMAGAPVPRAVHRVLLQDVLPDGAETYTPYGATEALPVCNFRGSEMLDETADATSRGAGMCVGRPVKEATVQIIETSDERIRDWDDGMVVPQGQIGEVVVKGAMVTRQYHNLPEATAGAKMKDGDHVRHRMGDLGYFDEQGRLWFCGRKSHRVETESGPLYTVQCEAVFNELDGVYRSALVGVGSEPGRQRPVIIIEPFPERFPSTTSALRTFQDRVLEAAGRHTHTKAIGDVLFHRSFPVDIRHNAKIRRGVLAAWAARQLRET